jgi:hypothetical protein
MELEMEVWAVPNNLAASLMLSPSSSIPGRKHILVAPFKDGDSRGESVAAAPHFQAELWWVLQQENCITLSMIRQSLTSR